MAGSEYVDGGGDDELLEESYVGSTVAARSDANCNACGVDGLALAAERGRI